MQFIYMGNGFFIQKRFLFKALIVFKHAKLRIAYLNEKIRAMRSIFLSNNAS